MKKNFNSAEEFCPLRLVDGMRVQKKIIETTKQQLTDDGWWTEPEQERVNVASGEDCLV